MLIYDGKTNNLYLVHYNDELRKLSVEECSRPQLNNVIKKPIIKPLNKTHMDFSFLYSLKI